MGNVNVHASILPRHRGAAPIAQAILAGDPITGVTTMLMDEGIDTGDILLQRSVEILPAETCGELTERLSLLGAELLMETLPLLRDGKIQPRPQDSSQATYDPMLSRKMGVENFRQDAAKVAGRINALNPWPCVSVPIGDTRLKLLRAVPTIGDGRPGTVITADPKAGLTVACGSGAVRILELQASGGKKMKAEDFLRGHSISAGTLLTAENEEDPR